MCVHYSYHAGGGSYSEDRPERGMRPLRDDEVNMQEKLSVEWTKDTIDNEFSGQKTSKGEQVLCLVAYRFQYAASTRSRTTGMKVTLKVMKIRTHCIVNLVTSVKITIRIIQANC